MKVINPDINIDPTGFRVTSWESDGKRVEMVRVEATIHFETFGLPIAEIKDAFDTWTKGFDLAVGHTTADAYPGTSEGHINLSWSMVRVDREGSWMPDDLFETPDPSHDPDGMPLLPEALEGRLIQIVWGALELAAWEEHWREVEAKRLAKAREAAIQIVERELGSQIDDVVRTFMARPDARKCDLNVIRTAVEKRLRS